MSKIECKLNAWREKAKERRIIIWTQKKRIKEILISRDRIRAKYKSVQLENRQLAKDLKELKRGEATKIKEHSYTAEEVNFFLNLRILGGCSLRGCLRVLEVLNVVLHLAYKKPSPSTIRMWEIKMGYEKINQIYSDTDSEWVLIIDESVSVGSQKILLLIGVDLKEYKFGSPLRISDVEVLGLWIGKSWKGEQIDEKLALILKRHYKFKYACSDNGNNLRKVLKINNLTHIEDCGHCLGKLLEKRYKKDSLYERFCIEKNRFRRQNVLSKDAVFLPPKNRTKGRFMNLWPTCEWSLKMLKIAEKYQTESVHLDKLSKIKWILDYEDFILKLHQEQQLINGVNKIIKAEGLSTDSIKKCEELMDESKVDELFKEEIENYLRRNFEKLPEMKKIICSSDVIESIFGKFKNSLNNNSQSGLTEGSLAIANYGKKTSATQVKKVLEEVKIVDILEWREENLPETLLQQRRKLFKNTG